MNDGHTDDALATTWTATANNGDRNVVCWHCYVGDVVHKYNLVPLVYKGKAPR